MSDVSTRLTALGDQVQAACAASGLEIVGFTILANNGAVATAESRSRIGRQEYVRALGVYVAAEVEDPRADEVAS